MVPARSIAVLVAAAAAFSGCASGWSINGQVVQSAPSSAGSTPLRGALVVLRCNGPAGPSEQVARADEQGVFQLQGAGPGPQLDCALTVAMDGYGALVYSVDQICADEDDSSGRCSAAAVQAELAPQQL
jgi:hypothetical protein